MQTYLKTKEILEVLNNTKHLDIPLKDSIRPEILNTIAIEITTKLNPTNQEQVTEFNDTFLVEREKDHVVDFFTTKELRLQLIVEETVELAFALGFTRDEFKQVVLSKLNRTYQNLPFINNGEKMTETFDALIDLLYVTYGALDAFNLADITEEGFREVHLSNMSKVCESTKVLEKTKAKYDIEGVETKSVASKNGFIIMHKHNNKVLKAINYKVANLKQILIKYLKI